MRARSIARQLLDVLCSKDATRPLDFLCPAVADLVAERNHQPGPSSQARHPRQRPERSSDRTRALRDPDPYLQRAPSSPTVLYQQPPRDSRAPRPHQRRSKPLTPDTIPSKYSLSSQDGAYHKDGSWSLHGRGVTCSAWPNAQSATPSTDFSSSDSAGALSGSNASATTDIADPSSSAFVVANLPSGWSNKSSTTPLSQPLMIGLSVVIAVTIAAVIIGLVTWRRPMCGRRRVASTASRAALEQKLRSLWDEERDQERGVPGRDEDPDTARAVKNKQKAWNRALTRWRAKGKGKAAACMRRQPSTTSSDTTTASSGLSTASTRSRTSLDNTPRSIDGSADSITRPLGEMPSSPIRGETVERPASPEPHPPRTPPPPLPPLLHVASVGHATASLPPRPDAAPLRPVPDDDDTEPAAGPPAYRRSYLGAQRRHAHAGNPSGADADLGSDSTSARGRPSVSERRERTALPHPDERLPPVDSKRQLDPVYEPPEPTAEAPPRLELDEPVAYDAGHIATDDKAVLARIGELRSQPRCSPAVASSSTAAASAPEWRDEEYADFESLEVPDRPRLRPCVLPAPPERVVQLSLGAITADASSAQQLDSWASHVDASQLPSTPPFPDDNDLESSAPPLELCHAYHMTPSAPPLDDYGGAASAPPPDDEEWDA